MSTASGLHERRPSENPTSSAHDALDGSTGGSTTSARAALQRLGGLVAGQLGAVGKHSWWSGTGRRGLTRAPGTPGGGARRYSSTNASVTSRVATGLQDLLGVFYVSEADHAPSRYPLHGHGDEHLSSAASVPLPATPGFPTPSPFMASTTRISPHSHARRPAALSRTGWLAVTLLFLLGLREIVVLSRMGAGNVSGRVKIKGRDPFAVLKEYGAMPSSTKGRGLGWDQLWMVPRPSPRASASAVDVEREERWAEEVGTGGDTTAIVLHWKRTDNVRVIVAHLCRYEFLDTVFVWNNNPDIYLTRGHFASTSCPPSRLRIYNSPRNMLFVARYLACLQSSTPYCFFQDDDWLVKPIRAIYSQFRRDPEGPVVVHTNSEVTNLYGLEWCFFQSPLHTCFSWVGTGAFSAKSHVERFLSTLTSINYPRDEVGHADNSFTLFQNEPPYVMSSELAQLPSPYGHSDGEGIKRNKAFIHKGLLHLTSYLALHTPLGSSTAPKMSHLLTTPLTIDSAPFLASPLPPLPPHPYAHHTRSPCSSDTCIFLTNIPLLPPPDAIPYPGPEVVQSLDEWENHLGWTARGWREHGGDGAEVWGEEEGWAKDWPHAAAVDGREGTAFRSRDVTQSEDYIALGLLTALDSSWVPRVDFVFTLEQGEAVLQGAAMVVEVSADGYRWFSPLNPTASHCRTTSTRSTLPDHSFPLSTLSSPQSQTIRSTETSSAPSTALGRWWTRRGRQGWLRECRVGLSSVLREGEGVGRGVEGWRFVRLRAERGMNGVGWGVYELKVEVKK